ncbi:helicase [Fragilaria crotonensis]|nr:helicase [Fragilaria crotonensis]
MAPSISGRTTEHVGHITPRDINVEYKSGLLSLRLGTHPIDAGEKDTLATTAAKHVCISEMLTAVAMMSSENIFYSQGNFSGKAAAAHRRFPNYEGDISMLMKVSGLPARPDLSRTLETRMLLVSINITDKVNDAIGPLRLHH